MTSDHDGALTRRAVTALTQLAADADEPDREWAAGLLAELDHIPAGWARLRWAAGGIWLLLTGSIGGRRARFAVLARRPARWPQRVLSLLLLPYAYLFLTGWAFTSLDYQIGDPRGPAFLALAVATAGVLILDWWRPVLGFLAGLIAWVAGVVVFLSPAGAILPDGGTPATGQRLAIQAPQVLFLLLPQLTLLVSLLAISLAPRTRTRQARAGGLVLLGRFAVWAVVFALIIVGPFLVGQVLQELGLWQAVTPVVTVLSVIEALVIPVGVLLWPLATLSRTGPGAGPDLPEPAGRTAID